MRSAIYVDGSKFVESEFQYEKDLEKIVHENSKVFFLKYFPSRAVCIGFWEQKLQRTYTRATKHKTTLGQMNIGS